MLRDVFFKDPVHVFVVFVVDELDSITLVDESGDFCGQSFSELDELA